MPVFPLVHSTMVMPGFELAAPLFVLDHRHADAVFHAAARIVRLELGHDAAGQPGADAPELDHRRAADGGGDVAEDRHIV